MREACQTSAVAIECDVRRKADVVSLISQTVHEFGALDILVANAGIVISKDFLEMSEEDFDAVLAVNLKGTFLVSFTIDIGCVQSSGKRYINTFST